LFLRTEPRIALINFLESEPEVFFVKGKYHGILVWRGDCICHTLLDMVMDNYHLFNTKHFTGEKRYSFFLTTWVFNSRIISSLAENINQVAFAAGTAKVNKHIHW
jgi:hypothetical protein